MVDLEREKSRRENYNFNYVLTSTPSVMCVLLYIFLVLLSVITICGNFLVIISIIYFKQLHTPTNYLILSLAVADLLVGIVVFPFSMAFSLSSCLYHEGLFCKVRSSCDISLSTCSILNLCCISVDRYYAVCQPLTYRSKINHCVVVIMILVSWGISALIGIGVIIAGLNNEKCEDRLIIMLCIYLKIFLVAQRQARSIHNTNCQSTKSGATVSKMERKATKTLATVLGVFLLFPVIETLNWLTLSNSMLNPFIYAFFYSWFRSAFRMIISGKIFQGDFQLHCYSYIFLVDNVLGFENILANLKLVFNLLIYNHFFVA
uniref:G-protein coupled receptors family 1 profile domain-containing protein n=1 Tax=Lates calcarifer TaxID=8187 RepID=A0A4W6F1V1_LATCA